MSVPNIFKYATKELSQDALICWLVACTKEPEEKLRACGRAFVQALFDSGDRTTVTKEGTPAIEPYRGTGCVSELLNGPTTQYKKIDVYFQARVDDKTVSFVVEDKTHTEMHGNQLNRHLGSVAKDRLEEHLIKPVYFKTGYVFEDERERAESAGFSVFNGWDMMTFLNARQRRGLSEILRQYGDWLQCVLNKRTKALTEWDLKEDFVQWEFMLALRRELRMKSAGWPVKHRNRGGSAWTQFPDWKNRNYANTRFFVNGSRHLYWRLDSGKPLRLMVNPHVVRKHTGVWTDEKWKCWSDAFDQARKESGLPEPGKRLRRVKRRKNDFVKEGLIGAVNLADFLTENGIDRCVQRIAHLQETFDKRIRVG